MAKTLTAAAVKNYRPGKVRREIPDAGCVGLHLVIQPQPSKAKSWAVRFRRPDGRPAKLTLGTCDAAGQEAEGEPAIGGHLTLAAARRLAAEIARQRALGRDPAADRIAEKRRVRTAAGRRAANTFGPAARDFIEQHTVKRTSERPRRWREIARVLGLDYPAVGGEPSTIKGGLAERWSDKPIAKIDGQEIHAVIDEARRFAIPGLPPRNSGASDPRGRKMADALGAMFKWLMRHRRGAIVANPCLGNYRPDAPHPGDRVLNSRRDVRGADELRWFWAACDAVGGPFGAVAKLLLLTGCRRDEIAKMRRDEATDDLATLLLPGARTKNNLPHVVPLSGLARETLTNTPRIEGCAYIFSTNGKTPVSGFSKFKRRLDAAMLAAAAKERGSDAAIPAWRLHDLRRTAATGMASIGVAPHIVEAVLNHVSGAKGGVAGTYNREQYEPEKRAALERWAAHVEGVVGGLAAANVVQLRGGASS
jgi:integrase